MAKSKHNTGIPRYKTDMNLVSHLMLCINVAKVRRNRGLLASTQRKDTVHIIDATQSIVQPVPTRHRRHACIKMRTALPANTRTWPNVVSMLVQHRWRWANIETALGQILAFAGLHTGVVYTHPSPTIIFSPADQGTF